MILQKNGWFYKKAGIFCQELYSSARNWKILPNMWLFFQNINPSAKNWMNLPQHKRKTWLLLPKLGLSSKKVWRLCAELDYSTKNWKILLTACLFCLQNKSFLQKSLINLPKTENFNHKNWFFANIWKFCRKLHVCLQILMFSNKRFDCSNNKFNFFETQIWFFRRNMDEHRLSIQNMMFHKRNPILQTKIWFFEHKNGLCKQNNGLCAQKWMLQTKIGLLLQEF